MINLKSTPQGTLLIYGATGYTGTLIVYEAVRRGLKFEIAGRSEDKLMALSALLNVPYHAFPVDDLMGWKNSLEGKTALLNIAGPSAKQQNRQWMLVFNLEYIILILQQK
jgi:short subunit dehydrogenase-like uncharacterized protein